MVGSYFDPKQFVVISLTGNHDLDREIVDEINNLSHAGLSFHHINMGYYPDEEIDNRVTDYETIADKNVIIFQSCHKQSLMVDLLDMAWATKFQYGAKRVIVVLPFMHYRRQDSKKESEIDRSKWFAHNLKSNGADIVLLCDIHSQTTLDDFRKVGIEAYNADPNIAYARHLRLSVQLATEDGRGFYIYVPDEGSIPRAVPLAKMLEVQIAINLKRRKPNGEVERIFDADRILYLQEQYGVELVEVDERLKGASFCIREDELSTGGTAAMAGNFLKHEIGATEVFFCATHAVCSPGWKRKIIDSNPFDNIFIGNTIHRRYLNTTGGQITNVSVAHHMATQIISILHRLD